MFSVEMQCYPTFFGIRKKAFYIYYSILQGYHSSHSLTPSSLLLSDKTPTFDLPAQGKLQWEILKDIQNHRVRRQICLCFVVLDKKSTFEPPSHPLRIFSKMSGVEVAHGIDLVCDDF